MYSIVVIDDELLAIQCIVKILEGYNKYPFHVITAQSGKEALTKLENLKPDILLVDIEMKEMDGFSLINEIHNRFNPLAKAIIVTAYSQFDYCKKAIGIHAFDYILKPVKTNELLSTLDKAMEDLEVGRRNKYDLNLYTQVSNERTIQRLLINKNAEPRESVNIREILDFFDHAYFFCAVLRVVEVQMGCGNLGLQLRRLINDIEHRHPGMHLRLMLLEISSVEYAIIGNIRELTDMNVVVNELYRLSASFAQTYSIGVFQPFSDFMDIRKYYEKALLSARQHLLDQRENQSTIYDYITLNQKVKTSNSMDYHRQVASIIELLSLGDFEATAKITELFRPEKYELFQDFRDTVLYCLTCIQQFSHEKDIVVEALSDLENMISMSKNVNEIIQRLTKQVEEIIFKIRMEKSTSSYQSIHRVIKYIDIHYKDNLSLNFVSSMAAVNSAYFCELFKKITGVTFVEYITKLRIEKAKSIIENKGTDFHITALADIVGYEDSDYFRRVFRKHTGMSPNQYKKRIQ